MKRLLLKLFSLIAIKILTSALKQTVIARYSFGCCVLSSNCQYIIKTICEGSSCYYLYERDYSYLTWRQSGDACHKDGLEMVRIESSQTQKVIERLLQDLPQNTQRKIWIGGQRSTDDKWRYMNGSEFNKQFTTSPQTASYCLYVKLCKDRAPEYRDDNCDEKITSSQLLCQYDESKTDSCSSSDSHFGDKCYRKTKYNGPDGNRIDWYNGETYCRQSDIQGSQTTITATPTTTTTTTTTTTPTRSTNSMFTKDISTDPVNKTTTTTTTIDTNIDVSNSKYTLNTVNIILIIITVISVTGVIILVVYCIQQRYPRNTKGFSTSDDVTQISTQIQQDIQDIQYEVIDGGREKRQNTEMSPDFVNIQRDKESDPYEKPSTYINMVDRPNPKAALGAMLTKGAVCDNLVPVARGTAFLEFKMAPMLKREVTCLVVNRL
ncbi:hypothetical protein LSH36_2259g00018 [Paralvinella palmiformis]|uniref:C-type lectin domain-containing protein n=1 Tax=Paralvinella palmiformis TaxID=53620 RepID=A0AAD9IQM5_9ANNE|nr:hypothetical protein LSH36_2259g00018 [Paralvinella palmiformis]